ncbi:MAG: hypothetical protein DVB29_00345 [Verrucomicrobia bacterium]|nr:MAG: hypothetical protein DVB29_00345 [Verrucomicrobiota bacterium]
MDAALSSKSSSGSMYSYSRRQTSSLALPHQPSRPPRHDQYEICGLRILTKFFMLGISFSIDVILPIFVA